VGSWKIVAGSQLQESIARQESLEGLVPESGGIYLWRRGLIPPPGVSISSIAFREWIENLMRIPLAIIDQKGLSHFATLERLRLGGIAINEEKLTILHELSQSDRGRELVIDFLAALSSQLPALYVGETANFRIRVIEHVTGISGFRDLVHEQYGLTIRDLEYAYYGLPPGSSENSKKIRTFLETIGTKLTLSSAVRRIG
jgi:hypothetical protein